MTQPQICIFTTLWPIGDKARLAEVTEAIRRNLALKEVERVFILCEGDTRPGPQQPNLTTARIQERPKFSQLFEYAANLNPDGINIILNSDIFLSDESVKKIRARMTGNKNLFLALTRWNVKQKTGQAELNNHADSQDAWVFWGKVKPGVVADFFLGAPGCDNRLAFLARQAGYRVLNPSRSIHTFHLHADDSRNYTAAVVPGPYYFPEICR